jgi:putative addiction module killer protein
MIEVHQSAVFETWLRRLKDDNAVARIVARIRRMEQGNLGDAKSVGAGVMELRVDYGLGYRIYYVQRGAEVVILLCGGDKRTQQRDIKRAHAMARDEAERR